MTGPMDSVQMFLYLAFVGANRLCSNLTVIVLIALHCLLIHGISRLSGLSLFLYIINKTLALH